MFRKKKGKKGEDADGADGTPEVTPTFDVTGDSDPDEGSGGYSEPPAQGMQRKVDPDSDDSWSDSEEDKLRKKQTKVRINKNPSVKYSASEGAAAMAALQKGLGMPSPAASGGRRSRGVSTAPATPVGGDDGFGDIRSKSETPAPFAIDPFSTPVNPATIADPFGSTSADPGNAGFKAFGDDVPAAASITTTDDPFADSLRMAGEDPFTTGSPSTKGDPFETSSTIVRLPLSPRAHATHFFLRVRMFRRVGDRGNKIGGLIVLFLSQGSCWRSLRKYCDVDSSARRQLVTCSARNRNRRKKIRPLK